MSSTRSRDTNQYRCGKVYALTGMQVHTRCGLPAHNDYRNRAAPHPAPNLLRPRALSGAVSVGHALSEYTPSLFKLEPHHHRPLRMAYPHTNNDPSPATKQTRGHGTTAAKPGKSRADSAQCRTRHSLKDQHPAGCVHTLASSVECSPS